MSKTAPEPSLIPLSKLILTILDDHHLSIIDWQASFESCLPSSIEDIFRVSMCSSPVNKLLAAIVLDLCPEIYARVRLMATRGLPLL